MGDSSPARSRPRRRWWWGVALLLVLAIAGWLWWQRTRPMVLVAHVPLGKGPTRTQITQAGLLVQGADTITLIGWDGKERWKVRRVPVRLESYSPWALSPDGRHLVVARTDGRRVILTQWCDGRPAGEVRIDTPARIFKLTATNDGRSWLLKDVRHGCQLWVVTGTHIASGSYTPPVPTQPDIRYGYYTRLAADGSTVLLGRFGVDDFLAVDVRGDQVVLTPRYSLQGQFAFNCALLPGGWAQLQDGSLYSPTGCVHGPDTWHCQGMNTDTLPMLQESIPGQRVRVFDPQHSTWEVPCAGMREIGNCSADGRRALVLDNGKPTRSNVIAYAFFHLPLVSKLYPASANTDHLVVYERPGRRLARLPVQLKRAPARAIAALLTSYHLALNGQQYQLPYQLWALSPDGTRVGILAENLSSKAKEWLVFGW